jgi:hypothetical protein
MSRWHLEPASAVPMPVMSSSFHRGQVRASPLQLRATNTLNSRGILGAVACALELPSAITSCGRDMYVAVAALMGPEGGQVGHLKETRERSHVPMWTGTGLAGHNRGRTRVILKTSLSHSWAADARSPTDCRRDKVRMRDLTRQSRFNRSLRQRKTSQRSSLSQ